MSDRKPIPRKKFTKRRIINSVVTIVACTLFVALLFEMNRNLLHASYTSGYVLLGSLFFLAAFTLRKHFSFLPMIGRASTWMQVHIYVGLATFLIFGMHIAWHVPDGRLESFLAILYLLVACSGVYGLFITRIIPKRLTAIGQEVVFERIPQLRSELAYEARQTALGCLGSTDVIPRFYVHQLFPFFEKGRGLAYLFLPTGRRRRQLMGELDGLKRYLSVEQREIGTKLMGYVQQKDDLDYHYAMQGRMKAWMFVHVGFTYSLLAVAVLHAILVHAFAGGLQ